MGPSITQNDAGVFYNLGSYQSGQMGLTVNQLRELRRFESSTAHLSILLYAKLPVWRSGSAQSW